MHAIETGELFRFPLRIGNSEIFDRTSIINNTVVWRIRGVYFSKIAEAQCREQLPDQPTQRKSRDSTGAATH